MISGQKAHLDKNLDNFMSIGKDTVILTEWMEADSNGGALLYDLDCVRANIF